MLARSNLWPVKAVGRCKYLTSDIGFHAGWWAADSIEDYYNSEKKDEVWETPFDFASWLYEDT